MGAWLEVWTRPGDPAYQKRIADLPFIDASANVAYSGVGKGSMRIPANYTRLDEILKTDPVTPSNSNWSTIKIVDDSGVLYEWLPSPRIPTGEKADVDVEFAGEGIESIWGFARVEPWDWDGSDSFVSKFPNWIWGGRNLLTNPGFETSGESPIIDELWIDGAVSGSFFLSDGTNNTAAIAWNENNPSVIEAELEAASPNPIYDDCLVTGTGTVDDPFIIEAVDPFEGVTLAVGTGLLVGGTADIRRVQFGSLQPTGWTRSTTVSDGSPKIFGSYASFRVTASQAHTGTYSLLVDPATVTGQGNRYAGAQQVIRVKPGGVYQASVWVRSTSATSTFRFVIRGVDGDFLASEPPALGSTTIAANTWTQFTIPDVNVGDNTQIIFRIAVTNPPTFNPGIFYVDDAVFSEGMAATTVGDMLGQLYVDATSAHVGRIVWEDESIPGSAYLGIDFDAVNDSDGAAWDRDDVAQTFRPRMTYLQVIDQIVNEGGYEWRLVADSTPGYYLLQVYNPGTLGATQTASIIAGSTDSARSARYFAPAATNVLAQGALETSTRVESAGLLAAFGRIEGSLIDQNLTSTSSIAQAAAEALAENRTGAEALVYTLSNPSQRPLELYRPGDTIRLVDPAVVTGQRRVSQIQISLSKSQVDEYVVSLSDATPFRNVGGLSLQRGLVGQAATDNAVAALLKAYKQADPLPAPADVGLGTGGGGMASVLVVDSFASDNLLEKADYVIQNNTNATLLFQDIIDTFGSNLQTIWLHGYAEILTPLVLPSGVQIVGLSSDQNSWLDLQDSGQITVGNGGLLRDLTIICETTDHAFLLGVNATAEHLNVLSPEAAGGSIFVLDIGARISDVWVSGGQTDPGAFSLIYLDGGSWQQVSNIVVNGFEGTVIRGDSNNQAAISDIVTNGCSRELILFGCFYTSISSWISNGAGDGDEPVVQIDDSSDVTFSGCQWIGFSAGTIVKDFATWRAGWILYASPYVTIDITNQFADFFPGDDDASEILLLLSHRCTISPTIIGVSSGTTFTDVDLVRVVESDDNFISYGHYELYDSPDWEPRHGIHITTTDSDRNVVVGNKMIPAAAYTGTVIEDNGTGTILLFPADATYGDNFT